MIIRHLLRVAAAIALLPALLLFLNLTIFAFFGTNFLPEGNSDMNSARGAVAWLSTLISMIFIAASI
jgi:hypothetical protein